MTTVVEGAGPFYFAGNRAGCLLLHGFTGTPHGMRQLGEYLAGQGYTVHGPRLFGHATQEGDLVRARFHDWMASAEDGYYLLRPNTEHLFVLGLSMGGALALLLAARFQVEGVVAMSTPYRLPPDPRLPFARQLSKIVRRIPKPRRRPSRGDDQPHYAYDHYPTRAIAELDDLLSEMRRSLPRVTAPTLLIQSRDDDSMGVTGDAIQLLHASLGARDKRMVWIDEPGHVITRGDRREVVFQHVAEFVEGVRSQIEDGRASEGDIS